LNLTKQVPTIGVLGTGSWGTALAATFAAANYQVNWFWPEPADRQYITCHHRNPRYLTSSVLPLDRICLKAKLSDTLVSSDIIFWVIPAAWIDVVISQAALSSDLELKSGVIFVSAIKGLEIRSGKTIVEYLKMKFPAVDGRIAVLGGPGHAEEVIKGINTFLTVGLADELVAKEIVSLFDNIPFLYVQASADQAGIEYAAVLKNIYAIAVGIAAGAGSGDNFLAALATACLREMEIALQQLSPLPKRNLLETVYCGDFLVTAYSQHSRNRSLGYWIGQGNTLQISDNHGNMVAEGYYAIAHLPQCLTEKLTILKTVYQVLYQHLPVQQALKQFIQTLN
jgi:glycerol-3-phosphate dehydrogenase (NAD(P)+)